MPSCGDYASCRRRIAEPAATALPPDDQADMNILEDLLGALPDDEPVRSVLAGVHWTLVCSRACGLAASLTNTEAHGHSRVADAGRLHLRSAHALARLAQLQNLLEASLGVAAINSLIEVDESRAVEINAGDVLAERGRGRNVALVGHFPFIPALRQVARNLWVIEQQPAADEYPAEAAATLIPQADVVAITGSALINHTLDGLLALCPSTATVMVLGPSTPLSPVLFEHGVHILSGARVFDEAAALRTISQGATFRQVDGVKRLTLSRES